MPNKNYLRSYARERELKLKGEKEKWLSTRTAGSHGVADVILIKPADDGHFLVRLIQVKVSEKFTKKRIEKRYEETPFGQAEVEYWMFPVRKRKR